MTALKGQAKIEISNLIDKARERYRVQTPNKQINKAIEVMQIKRKMAVSRRFLGEVCYAIFQAGKYRGNQAELAYQLCRNVKCVSHALVILREFGLVVATKELGETVYTVDPKRLAKPSKERVCNVTRMVATRSKKPKPPPQPSIRSKPKGPLPTKAKANARCPGCGCRPSHLYEGVCYACHLVKPSAT